ncbi:MAG TPA: hypothetical protein VFA06_24840 [Actinocrinis sp.]|uniref:hypothetical protein n=1 Tax=Actinocrinis sp. TaxID=1920516 RepID=UPI002D4BF1FF|nr:hypothetical protein [Actinocrinis sp.]HZU59131.1 hypothetical protein [Actinocrinis sp.]
MDRIDVSFEFSEDHAAQLRSAPPGNPVSSFLARKLAASSAATRILARLVGPTRIEVSADGVSYTGPADAATQRVGWARIASVNERPMAWTFTLAPSGMYVIPKSVVPRDEHAEFSRRLREFAGPKYKVRKG